MRGQVPLTFSARRLVKTKTDDQPRIVERRARARAWRRLLCYSRRRAWPRIFEVAAGPRSSCARLSANERASIPRIAADEIASPPRTADESLVTSEAAGLAEAGARLPRQRLSFRSRSK